MSRKYEYINISTPKVRAKPGISHDLQLLRDLEIVNARMAAELGPLPPGGMPVVPKGKCIPPQSAAMPVHGQENFECQEEKAMKLNQVVAAAALTAGMVACEPSLKTGTDEQQPATAKSATTMSATESIERQTDKLGFYGNDYGIRPAYEICVTHQPDGVGTANHRQACADQEFEFQDARLNRVYQNAMGDLKDRGNDGVAKSLQLRDEQRAWLSKLEKMCAEVAEKAGSLMGPAAQSTCFMDQTALRANELERIYGKAESESSAASTQDDLLAFGQNYWSKQPTVRDSFKSCWEAATTPESKLVCIRAEMAHQENAVNKTYKELHSLLPEKKLVALQDDLKPLVQENGDSCRFASGDAERDHVDEQFCKLYKKATLAKHLDVTLSVEQSNFVKNNLDVSKPESSSGVTKLQKSFKECMGKSQGTTAEMMDCMGAEFEYQDIRLNSAYNDLKKILPSSEWQKLKAEQKQWLGSADRDCTDDSLGGGTAQMVVDKMCRLERTKVRANELQVMLGRSRTKRAISGEME